MYCGTLYWTEFKLSLNNLPWTNSVFIENSTHCIIAQLWKKSQMKFKRETEDYSPHYVLWQIFQVYRQLMLSRSWINLWKLMNWTIDPQVWLLYTGLPLTKRSFFIVTDDVTPNSLDRNYRLRITHTPPLGGAYSSSILNNWILQGKQCGPGRRIYAKISNKYQIIILAGLMNLYYKKD